MVIKRREASVDKLSAAEGLHPLLARLYAARGIQSSNELSKELPNLLPFSSLMGIESAVDCLVEAIESQHTIVVVGDFDADGATSTTLAVKALQAMGAQKVDFFVPNRFEYGYGLTPEVVAAVAPKGAQLLITVDNGITSLTGVEAANHQGMKVVITDHHVAGEDLPDAAAIVNPNQKGDEFPSKNLAGVGVIFYVMLALRARLQSMDWFEKQGIARPNMAQFLDLVALGTVADVVTLDANNRLLVHHGLQRIRAGKASVGLMALIAVAGRDYHDLVAADLGFAVGPRLNAAGRIDDMSLGIACLLTQDPLEAHRLASHLDTLNKERRRIEEEMQREAFGILNKLELGSELPAGLCLFDPNWHEGIVGILAARIKERVHRPVIVFTKVDDSNLKGSARSIPGVHIRDVLSEVAAKNPGLLTKFGGHAMAAGLSLAVDQLDVFSKAFDGVVRRFVGEDDLEAITITDGELAGGEHTLEIAQLLRDAGPWGQGFPEPVFDDVFYLIDQRVLGGKHLKMQVKHKDGDQVIDAIAFNIDTRKWPDQHCRQVHLAYQVDVNTYQGVKRVQLMVRHLQAVK